MDDSALENELHAHVVDVFAMNYHSVSLADCSAHTIRCRTVFNSNQREIDNHVLPLSNDRATLLLERRPKALRWAEPPQ